MESLLCHLNSHLKKQGPIKSEVTKVFSLAASFAWTMEQEIEDGNKIWKYGGNPDMIDGNYTNIFGMVNFYF